MMLFWPVTRFPLHSLTPISSASVWRATTNGLTSSSRWLRASNSFDRLNFALCERTASQAREESAPPPSACLFGCDEHNAHRVTLPRPSSEVPIMGITALLQLVEWYHVRWRSSQQGGSSCVGLGELQSPPRQIRAAHLASQRQLWLTLPVESRERILLALSRVVAQQLATPPDSQEVPNERS